jgi:hypothetical protein
MSEFKLMCAALDAVDRALDDPQADDPPLKCRSCDWLQTVYQYPMDEQYGQECLGDQCTRPQGVCVKGVDPRD